MLPQVVAFGSSRLRLLTLPCICNVTKCTLSAVNASPWSSFDESAADFRSASTCFAPHPPSQGPTQCIEVRQTCWGRH
ncbi:uncharacterized protein LACBIDRAFT_298726 [Laccaria bicolor S238N-H82]|uniref:Predicted protein n=1 Tax=Laccaria bicolor (strain S238N-H82 / ATCC MYA-4686) TaxID=486041 RepID=B0DDH5_LACBS|nr:uncharacterized protein LACBIDRAFT_298726 [Laccaria bicolor S238N-H82]EDR07611.1 predicted protein [Laccaria bicolor S238N-H82]|eukprot:XP_001882003.1 predicted protein [Laccaria bicolor S238N-H82]